MSLDLRKELSRVALAFQEAGIAYAICGGLAVAIHGYPRATRDIDLLIRQEDLERVKAVLERVGFDLAAGLLPFDAGKETERYVYRVSKAEAEDLLTLDLILLPPFLEDVWAGRETHQIGDQVFQVVSLEGLARMKRIAGRAQDQADLSQLGLNEEP